MVNLSAPLSSSSGSSSSSRIHTPPGDDTGTGTFTNEIHAKTAGNVGVSMTPSRTISSQAAAAAGGGGGQMYLPVKAEDGHGAMTTSARSVEQRLPENSLFFRTLAWLCLVLGVLSGSAIGPTFKYMNNLHINPCLAASWRCQCMCLFLIPMALIERAFSSFHTPWMSKEPGLDYPVYVHVSVGGIAWGLNLICWITGLMYTTTVRAAIFAGMHPLMLCCFFCIMRPLSVSKFEIAGVIVSFLGLVVAGFGELTDSSDNNDGNISGGQGSFSLPKELFGDFLCVCASAFEVVVILNRHKIKPFVPLMQYTAITTIFVALMTTVMAVVAYDGVDVLCTRDDCIFGWFSERWALIMLVFGFIVGVVCIAGFNFAMTHISPLIFSSVLLADPACTGLISWATGLEGIPDLSTWLGGIVVIVGVLCISFGEHSREQAVERSKAQESEFLHELEMELSMHNSGEDDQEKDDGLLF